MLEGFLRELYKKSISFDIFPEEEGVVVEFPYGLWDYSVEFNNGLIIYYAIKVDSNDELLPRTCNSLDTLLRRLNL